MKKNIIEDKLGYKKIEEKPTRKELKDYYEKKYYSQQKNYHTEYSHEEIKYLKNKLNQKFLLLNNHLDNSSKSFLELGSGEGWVLNKFYENGFQVLGLDYSDTGCKNHNPKMIPFMKLGDLENEIMTLDKKFDVIWIENVLEHVIEPKELIKNTKIILKESGLLAVSVPNDFSLVQMDLLKKGRLKNKEYWISPPDHLSYFNKETLIRFFEEFNFNLIDLISDYPIDLNLYCDLTNYVDKKSIGGKVHKKRIEIENLFSSISDEKTNNLSRCFADLGIGRDYFAIFKKAI